MKGSLRLKDTKTLLGTLEIECYSESVGGRAWKTRENNGSQNHGGPLQGDKSL